MRGAEIWRQRGAPRAEAQHGVVMVGFVFAAVPSLYASGFRHVRRYAIC